MLRCGSAAGGGAFINPGKYFPCCAGAEFCVAVGPSGSVGAVEAVETVGAVEAVEAAGNIYQAVHLSTK